MKILFGIPVKDHNEIAMAEVLGFQEIGNEVFTSEYGNSGSAQNLISMFLLVLKNAIKLKIKSIRHKTDLVFLNTAFDRKTIVRDSITLFFLKFLNKKVKVVLKTHGTIKAVVFSENFFRNYLFRKADLFLVLSKEELNNFLEAGIDKEKVNVTCNVVNPLKYTPDPEFKEKNKIEKDKLVLLFVGRFIKEKGIIDLIHACKLLKNKGVKFELLCLGNGALFENARTLTKSLDLQDDIKFFGHLPESETNSYYSNCDILILPTYHEEGFPMAVFNAVACGKPVITTKIRAAADHLKSFENCLWVEPEKPEDIFQKIEMLANSQKLRESMVNNNFKLITHFSREMIVNELNLIFLSFFNKKGHKVHKKLREVI